MQKKQNPIEKSMIECIKSTSGSIENRTQETSECKKFAQELQRVRYEQSTERSLNNPGFRPAIDIEPGQVPENPGFSFTNNYGSSLRSIGGK